MTAGSARPAATRIGLVRLGDRPRVNKRLYELLASTFDRPVDDIDVLSRVRASPVASASAVVSGAFAHAGGLVSGRTTKKRAFVDSRGFNHFAHRIVESQVSPLTHGFTFQSQSLCHVAVPGVPHFVYTDHAHLANLGYPGFDQRRLSSARFLRMESEVFHSASMVFVRSQHVRDVIVHGYGCPADRVAVVGVGPNTPPPRHTGERAWNGGRIAFVGVDWERKGGPDLVAAFETVRAEHPTARLEIIGCEPAGIGGEGITVHGRLTENAVADLLGACDLFCLPTHAEPFGVAFVEAMHAGLPVVATAVGAIPELVEPGVTGELVEPGDVQRLAQALTSCVGDPAHSIAMGERGREIAARRYTWDVVMGRIRELVTARLASVSEPTGTR